MNKTEDRETRDATRLAIMFLMFFTLMIAVTVTSLVHGPFQPDSSAVSSVGTTGSSVRQGG